MLNLKYQIKSSLCERGTIWPQPRGQIWQFRWCSKSSVYYVNWGGDPLTLVPPLGLTGQIWGLRWCNKSIVYYVNWGGDPCKSTLVPHLVSRDKFGDPPVSAASQPLWAGIENTGQSVSHSVLTPALRVPKTHLGANLGVRNLCGRILEVFVFSLTHCLHKSIYRSNKSIYRSNKAQWPKNHRHPLPYFLVSLFVQLIKMGNPTKFIYRTDVAQIVAL